MSTPIPDRRALTPHEVTLARWMLAHGTPEATPYLQQLDGVRVASRCPCGCASIDFEMNGSVAPPGGLTILGDYVFEDPDGALAGAFIFARNDTLAGIEVYGLAGDAPRELPAPESLRQWGDAEPRRPHR